MYEIVVVQINNGRDLVKLLLSGVCASKDVMQILALTKVSYYDWVLDCFITQLTGRLAHSLLWYSYQLIPAIGCVHMANISIWFYLNETIRSLRIHFTREYICKHSISMDMKYL